MKVNDKRKPRTKLILSLAVIGLVASYFGYQILGEAALAKYEEPNYTVLKTYENFEIREYAKKIAAEVEVKGDQRMAMNKGFRILASYIFGKNTPQEKIAMTSPVVSEKTTKIAMTSPVTVDGSENSWKVTFYMPQEFTLETLPKPVDQRISISEVPEVTYAVKRFSGRWTKENFNKHKKRLLESLENQDIAVLGEAVNAYYNPPFTPPFMRRNEIMVPVVAPKAVSEKESKLKVSSI